MLVSQPDVNSPSVQTVEQYWPHLQLGTSIVHSLHLVGARQVHAQVGEGLSGDVELLLGQAPHLLRHSLLVVDLTELTVLDHLLRQGPV